MINICNIERFATHDGDGIRTVVFLQGCPLRCPWCANPESQIIKTQLMHDKKKCIGCRNCEKVCPKQAIKFIDGKFMLDVKTCKACKKCADICLQEAISFSGEAMSVEQIVEEVMKDKDYYDASNGGVTLSGGECFVQFEGFFELLQAFKKEGLNITIETCGQFPLEHLIKADPYIDSYYFDIKHLDADIYRQVVKGDIDIVMRNVDYLIKKDPSKVVFRVPVIPGFNYNEDVLNRIIDFAAVSKVRELHFLPYHTLAMLKYEKLMHEYEWTKEKLSDDSLKAYVEIAKRKNVTLKIGG